MASPETDKVKVKKGVGGRKRRVAGWTLLTLGVIVAGVFVASRWWTFGYENSLCGVRPAYTGGCYLYSQSPVSRPRGWMLHRVDEDDRTWEWVVIVQTTSADGDMGGVNLGVAYVQTSQHGWSASVRLWFVSLTLVLIGALLLRSGRLAGRRACAGACVECGYSLAGLGDGAACPECGKGAGTA